MPISSDGCPRNSYMSLYLAVKSFAKVRLLINDARHGLELLLCFPPLLLAGRRGEQTAAGKQRKGTLPNFHASEVHVYVCLAGWFQHAEEPGVITPIVPFMFLNKPKSVLLGESRYRRGGMKRLQQ